MKENNFLTINQLSHVYGLPDITLYRDFQKLRTQNKGVEGSDYIKFYKNPKLNKFEWRINPEWFENSVERKLRSSHQTYEIGSKITHDYGEASPQTSRTFTSSSNQEASNKDSSLIDWLKEKIDELSEMLKNSQILIAQKDKQIDSLQQKVFSLEPPTLQQTSEVVTNTSHIKKQATINSSNKDEMINNEKVNEVTFTNDDLEELIDDDGNVVSPETFHNHDQDVDPWVEENEHSIPAHPNSRGPEGDPRALNSEDQAPIEELPIEDVSDIFSRIANERGY